MIFIPTKCRECINPKKLEDSNWDLLYQHHLNQNSTFLKLIAEIQEKNEQQASLLIADSVLRNLNYGRVEHSLGSLDRTENLYSNSQGIVATINDFKGSIEFRNNSITHNMVFIPSAILSNN